MIYLIIVLFLIAIKFSSVHFYIMDFFAAIVLERQRKKEAKIVLNLMVCINTGDMHLKRPRAGRSQ